MGLYISVYSPCNTTAKLMCMLMRWKYQTSFFRFHVFFIYLVGNTQWIKLRGSQFHSHMLHYPAKRINAT